MRQHHLGRCFCGLGDETLDPDCDPGPYRDHYGIANMVGRLHVGTPDAEVIEYVISRFKKSWWAKLPATQKRQIECAAKLAHAENRKVYLQVMRGR